MSIDQGPSPRSPTQVDLCNQRIDDQARELDEMKEQVRDMQGTLNDALIKLAGLKGYLTGVMVAGALLAAVVAVVAEKALK